MCGICGILNRDLAPVDLDTLQDMTRTLVHRGPDDEGFLTRPGVGLGMRRLSVIDVEGGHQPISNEDATVHVVLNGEIYNHADLRCECEARGHRFTTRSDTEAIVHLYEEYGDSCVDHLNGMFAFALFDQRRNRVLIARDRLGIKPLYYAQTPRGLRFGSEVKSILRSPDVPTDVDSTAVLHYLTYKYIPGPRTIYQAVRELPPGHILVWQDGACTTRPYWTLPRPDASHEPENVLAEELVERLDESVRRRMLADVPLGALLSGGVDSSVIVGLMSRHASQPVKTFSIGFEEKSYNELEHARCVARRFGTDHHELVVKPDVADLFETVVPLFDQPFGDSSAIPTYLVSQLARQHVTVALSGTGADELFAGYERYRAVPLGQRWQAVPNVGKAVIRRLLELAPSGHGKRSLAHRAKRFVSSADRDALGRHREIVSLFPGADTAFRPEFLEAIDNVDDPLCAAARSASGMSDLDRLMHVDRQTLLPGDYLAKDDRTSMAVSLELRVPFLDHTFVEFAATVPERMKLRGLTTKHILKQAASELLPESIIQRPKHGFELPVAHWIGNELRNHVSDLLLAPDALHRSVLIEGLVDRTMADHLSGRENRSREIWSLMALEMWHRASVPTVGRAVSRG